MGFFVVALGDLLAASYSVPQLNLFSFQIILYSFTLPFETVSSLRAELYADFCPH